MLNISRTPARIYTSLATRHSIATGRPHTTKHVSKRLNRTAAVVPFSSSAARRYATNAVAQQKQEGNEEDGPEDVIPAEQSNSLGTKEQTEHAVISAFDLFSIGGTCHTLATSILLP